MGAIDNVRRATPADAELVASIVTLAFVNDPLWGPALARSDGSTAHHRRFWRLFAEGALRYPWTWLVGDGEAVSIWIPPGGSEMTTAQEDHLADLADECLGEEADNYRELLGRFETSHPRVDPHYTLSLLATHPDHRGRGIGMALLARNLELIDAERLPAYLESSNPANNERYASLGFEPVGQFEYPGGGPVVTTMWRPPR